MVYTINGLNYYPIQEFAQMIGREVTSLRHLLFAGNTVRRMHYVRDRSRIFIPVEEYSGYPFTNPGRQQYGQDIYHYDEKGNRVLCKTCTFGTEGCEARKAADRSHDEGEKSQWS